MQPQQGGSSVLLHNPPCRGCCLLFLCLLSLSISLLHTPLISVASAKPVARPHYPSNVVLRPEGLLDSFVCMRPWTGEEKNPTSPPDDDDDVFVDDWKPQLPCVNSRSVSVFVRNRIEPGNVMLLADIDDTLIASGGWTWIGKSLGGTDDRYARGSEYPGFGSLLYLLGLGPHLRDVHTADLKLYRPPLPIAVVTGRPNVSFFRPDYLLPHIDSILTKGARQITTDDDLGWKVGAENNVLSPKLFQGVNGRGELKVAFGLNAIRGKERVEGAHLDSGTKFMFVGDTGERDPEVALALATVEPGALVAVFINVVRRSEDPGARQTIPQESEDEQDCDQCQEDLPLRGLPGTETLSAFGEKFATVMRGAAASIAGVAGRAQGVGPIQKKSSGNDVGLNMDFIKMLAAAEEGRAGPLFMDGKTKEELPKPPTDVDSVVIQIEPDTEEDFIVKTKKLGRALAEAGDKLNALFTNYIQPKDPFWAEQTAVKNPQGEHVPKAESSAESMPAAGSSAGSMPEAGPSAENLPEAGSSAENLPEAGSSAENLPEAGSSAENLPEAGSSAENLPEAEPSAENLPEAEPSAGSMPEAEVSGVLRSIGDEVENEQQVQRALHGGFRSSQRKHIPPRVSVSEALADTRRFAIQVGETLVDAIQVLYDVHITTDEWESPQSCSALSTRQAFAVGSKVGQKLRNIFDAYEHRWKHSPDNFNVAAPGIAGLSSSRCRTRRPLPLVFVKCNSVSLHLTTPASNWRKFWKFFTETSERIDVQFVVSKEPLQSLRSSMSTPTAEEENGVSVLLEELDPPRIGTPVAPYTTTLSTAAHAYVLGLIDLIDVSVVIKKTHEALRSHGPMSHSSRLPVLLDHLNDLEALKFLFFGQTRPAKSPVKEIATMIDNYLISQHAFAKRAAYVRAFPNRQHECVHDLQRALLEKSRATRGQKNAWRFNQGKLVAFGTPFASLVCKFDLELASIQQAGSGELVGLSHTVTKVVREAFLATERVKCKGEPEECGPPKKYSNRGLRRSRSGDSEDTEEAEASDDEGLPISERCKLSEDELWRFREYYVAMCEAFSPIACQLLEMRLEPAVLEDLVLLAESRIANGSSPVDLPHFGLRVFPDENVQDYFENLHQRPAAQFLGFLGNPLDYALQPAEDGKGHFEKWPAVDSGSRWKMILETLEQLLYCELIG